LIGVRISEVCKNVLYRLLFFWIKKTICLLQDE